MNQNQIHPALRQTALSSPAKPQTAHYPDATAATYASIQPSPTGSYQSIHTPTYYPAAQQVQDSPEDGSPSANPADPNDLKRPRACEACRQLKVKCELDDNSPTGSCKRCAKAHRVCVVTVPSRKRQKKTDSRVAELEKKIDALTATLASRGTGDLEPALDPALAYRQNHLIQQQQHSQQRHHQVQPSSHADQWQPSPPPPLPHQQQRAHTYSPSPPVRQPGLKRKPSTGPEYFGHELPKTSPSQFKASPPVPQFHAAYGEQKHTSEPDGTPYVDVIDRNIIDASTAYRCYDRYKSEMSNQLPIVMFPYDQTAAELRRSSPLLFLAVVAVGSNTIRPHLQPKLTGEVMRALGDRIFTNGEKSMELVQAIQLMTIFYQPPERYDELNFNQLVHIAAVMAMDLGMGKRTKKGPFPPIYKNKGNPDPTSVEARRCWLGCYYMCTNSAMSLRRPLLIRWSPYTDECIQVLMTSKDALPSDKLLCQFVKAQHIGENIQIEFSMDDPAQTLSLTDPQTQRQLKVFEQNLAEWHESGSDMMNEPIMKHTEAIMNLYMHEIAMHRDHNIDDFRPPFNNPSIEGPPNPELVTPSHVRSLTACLHSVHNAFEAFLSMDVNALRALPTHIFVRNSYAAVALIRLYAAVAAKGSKFGSILEKEELKVESYLDRLIETLQKVSQDGMSRVAQKFDFIFGTLRKWHLKRLEAQTPVTNGNQPSDGFKAEGTDYKSGPAAVQDTSQAWSNPNRTTADQQNTSQQHHQHQQQLPPPRSRLQMLSDAAMAPAGPSSHSGQTPPPGGSSSSQWNAVPPPPSAMNPNPMQQQQQQQSIPGLDTGGGMNIPPNEYNMLAAAYGASNDPLAMSVGFTSDDFMAFGLGNDFFNFGGFGQLGQDGTWVV